MKKSVYKSVCALFLALSLLACDGGNYKASDGHSNDMEEKKDEAKSEEMPSAEKKASAKDEANALAPSQKATEREMERSEPPAGKMDENAFESVAKTPFSTFSIDVDNASYTQARQSIMNYGVRPMPNLVRIEEFVNYFDYMYPQPKNNAPFSVYTELGMCPWNKQHKIFHIGLKGKELQSKKQPSNLVFLIDVSGSMNDANKLPLLKRSFKYLLDNLGEEDKVSIVVYAGAAGLVLPPTSNKSAILNALENLQAGGSTAGGEGLRLAYKMAEKAFLKEGNNRIILASDGDFNVGESSIQAMEQLVAEKRAQNIFITVLGFGAGNYQDERMEVIANKGNGNYYYIDSDNEARKVFGTGLTGTLFTIAKDVKIQLEFNPNVVKHYRLLGYENRMLAKEDFHNDKKDAGEIGAGHTVTAIYEVELVNDTPTDKLLTLNLRYKEPKGEVSKLLSYDIKKMPKEFDNCTEDFRFAAAVAEFGLLLRNSQYKGSASYADVELIAKKAMGNDSHGYRKEFIELVRRAGSIQ
jgi:Ca-activated chloride channel family protein